MEDSGLLKRLESGDFPTTGGNIPRGPPDVPPPIRDEPIRNLPDRHHPEGGKVGSRLDDIPPDPRRRSLRSRDARPLRATLRPPARSLLPFFPDQVARRHLRGAGGASSSTGAGLQEGASRRRISVIPTPRVS
jgi:hypothetical protein